MGANEEKGFYTEIIPTRRTMTDSLNSRGLFLTVVEVISVVILNVLSFTGNTFVCISVQELCEKDKRRAPMLQTPDDTTV